MANQDEIIAKFRYDVSEALKEVKKVESAVKKMHDEVNKGGQSIPNTAKKIASSKFVFPWALFPVKMWTPFVKVKSNCL